MFQQLSLLLSRNFYLTLLISITCTSPYSCCLLPIFNVENLLFCHHANRSSSTTNFVPCLPRVALERFFSVATMVRYESIKLNFTTVLFARQKQSIRLQKWAVKVITFMSSPQTGSCPKRKNNSVFNYFITYDTVLL